MNNVIDVDDPSTWPAPLLDWVDEWAERRRGTTEYTSDLHISEDDELLRMLASYMVRAYHCTRLLPHERGMVLEQGLRPLSAELVADRIRRAHEAGALTDDERRAFDAGHQFVLEGWEKRVEHTQKQVCLVFSREVFEHGASGVEPLLSTWGGEAIYFPLDREHGERLRSMGRPSIVVANLDLSARPFGTKHYIAPGLGCCLVGMRLGLENPGAEILYRAPVPAANVVAIWQPGDTEYDRHTRLPRR